VARSATTATMNSAAASSSALGLVFAATLPVVMAMVPSAASSTPPFAASVQVQYVAANGAQFVVAALLLHALSVCRARHRLLVSARTVPAPATLHRAMLKPQRHQSLKPRCRLLRKSLQSPSLCPRTSPWSRCRRHQHRLGIGATSARSSA
jgi:hypothetical protein